MLTKRLRDYKYHNRKAHFENTNVLITLFIVSLFLLFCSFSFLKSQTDNTTQPKIKIFNKVGQRESIRVGENVSIVLGPNIKPEYSYFAYYPGKTVNEYFIELKSNEPLLREISMLRNSIDSIRVNQKTAIKAEELANQSNHDNSSAAGSKIIQKKDSSINKPDKLMDAASRDNDFSIFSTGKYKKYIDNLKNRIDSNNITINKYRSHIDTLRKKLDNIRMGNDLSGMDALLEEINFYEKKNDDLAKLNQTLSTELKTKERDYENLFIRFIYLIVGTVFVLILAFVLYWNYRQKKHFSNQLSEINTKLEFSNSELQNTNAQLQEQNIRIKTQNEQLIKLNNEKDDLLRIIKTDLKNASEYVTSLIPKPIINHTADKIRTDWLFIPSTDLGGDAFGYNWINKENFAFYLLDVSGHGIGAALHSVQVLNLLHNKTLPNVDFAKPDEVLAALNKIFQMEDHNDLFFTLWYGVFNKTTGILRYASAGHPPAILYCNGNELNLLSSQNIFIGAAKNIKFKYNEIKIDKPSELFLYSDGVYELMNSDRKLYSMTHLPAQICDVIIKGKNNLNALYENAKKYTCKDSLEDDYSILKINFD